MPEPFPEKTETVKEPGMVEKIKEGKNGKTNRLGVGKMTVENRYTLKKLTSSLKKRRKKESVGRVLDYISKTRLATN